jgi:hypothetical protein
MILATKMQIGERLKYEVRGRIGVLMLTLLQDLTRKMIVAMRYAFFLELLSTFDVYKNWSNMKRRYSMLLRPSIDLTASWPASVK